MKKFVLMTFISLFCGKTFAQQKIEPKTRYSQLFVKGDSLGRQSQIIQFYSKDTCYLLLHIKKEDYFFIAGLSPCEIKKAFFLQKIWLDGNPTDDFSVGERLLNTRKDVDDFIQKFFGIAVR